MQPVIRFENVGKLYRLGTVGTGTLSHDLRRWWITSVMRKEDPYLKIGETNDRSSKGSSDYVYALKDINLEVREGDVLGIIGKNGAGKSTLLKLLSRVTAPTTGKIYTKGRIATLLEVGTGFHPELTGRENIYMNGAILGMKKWEINKRLDEIIDFSGCERYIDTPVKRYSSGMMVRLGFAVAAHLDPEILVVDEVLAVGDAEFQKKAIGKMQEVSKGQGRTVLFVSHNMNSIKMLCKTGIVLKNGILDYSGEIGDCVDYYLQENNIDNVERKVVISDAHREKYEFLNGGLLFDEAEILNDDPSAIATDEDIVLRISLKNEKQIDAFQLCVFFQDSDDARVCFFMSDTITPPKGQEKFTITTTLKNHYLPRGNYSIRLETNYQDFTKGSTHFDFVHHTLYFNIKYIHKDKKDEYLFWNKNFGQTLHLGGKCIELSMAHK